MDVLRTARHILDPKILTFEGLLVSQEFIDELSWGMSRASRGSFPVNYSLTQHY